MDLRPVPDPDARNDAGEAEKPARARQGFDDLQAARDLLARTIRFLTLCQKDPAEATARDDPTELVEALEQLELGHDEQDSSESGAGERRRDSA